jgi:hypothetical protein
MTSRAQLSGQLLGRRSVDMGSERFNEGLVGDAQALVAAAV